MAQIEAVLRITETAEFSEWSEKIMRREDIAQATMRPYLSDHRHAMAASDTEDDENAQAEEANIPLPPLRDIVGSWRHDGPALKHAVGSWWWPDDFSSVADTMSAWPGLKKRKGAYYQHGLCAVRQCNMGFVLSGNATWALCCLTCCS